MRLAVSGEPQRHKRGLVALVLEEQLEPPVRQLIVRLKQLQHRPERRGVCLPADGHQPAVLVHTGCASPTCAEQQREFTAQITGLRLGAVIPLEDRRREGGLQPFSESAALLKTMQRGRIIPVCLGGFRQHLLCPGPAELAFTVGCEAGGVLPCLQHSSQQRGQPGQQLGIALPAPADMPEQPQVRKERQDLLGRQHHQLDLIGLRGAKLRAVEGFLMPGEQQLLELDTGHIIIPVIHTIDQRIPILGKGELDGNIAHLHIHGISFPFRSSSCRARRRLCLSVKLSRNTSQRASRFSFCTA